MTTFTRKTLIASLSALTLGTAVIAAAAPAEARPWRYHGGGVVAAGVVGGLVLGAAAASAAAAHSVYVAPAYYATGCARVRQPVTDVYGNVRYVRTVKVCH